MTITLELLEAEAMKLPIADRTRLLERLVESLDADRDIEAAWDAVADEREARTPGDSPDAVPFDEALARLKARFPG